MERIVISTGRCGSTLLSTLFALHPQVLSLSEFHVSVRPIETLRLGGPAVISGEQYAARLAKPQPVTDLSLNRSDYPEIVNKNRGGDIPVLMYSFFPLLSNDPERLFAESIDRVKTFPTQSIANHNLMYMEWLTSHLNRKIWVERSGTSIEFLPELARMYPNAKYVHIHRDGPEAALSMYEHDYFKLWVSFDVDPPTRAELLRTELGGNPVIKNNPDDPLYQRMTTRVPTYEQFGEHWSHMIEVGYPELAKMTAKQLLTVRFEDLMSQPADTLRAIASFWEFPEAPGWLEKAVRGIKPPKLRAGLLPENDRIALERGCRRGQYLLGRVGRPQKWDEIFEMLFEMRGIYR